MPKLPPEVKAAIREDVAAAKQTRWEIVGQCGMDTARLLIADPCYIVPPAGAQRDREINDYDALSPMTGWKDGVCTSHAQINYKRGHPGAGLLIDSPHGDGTVTIYAKLDAKNRVRAVFFSFDGEKPPIT